MVFNRKGLERKEGEHLVYSPNLIKPICKHYIFPNTMSMILPCLFVCKHDKCRKTMTILNFWDERYSKANYVLSIKVITLKPVDTFVKKNQTFSIDQCPKINETKQKTSKYINM